MTVPLLCCQRILCQRPRLQPLCRMAPQLAYKPQTLPLALQLRRRRMASLTAPPPKSPNGHGQGPWTRDMAIPPAVPVSQQVLHAISQAWWLVPAVHVAHSLQTTKPIARDLVADVSPTRAPAAWQDAQDACAEVLGPVAVLGTGHVLAACPQTTQPDWKVCILISVHALCERAAQPHALATVRTCTFS
jgi:hypothetical protein